METRKLAVIMFTDMVGYSQKVSADEEQALQLLGEHNRILEAQISAYKGRVIKTIGDAFLADFDSVFNAVNCAVDVQKQLAQRNAQAPPAGRIEVRIGIHVGDVIYRDQDVFGDGVNIANRLESIAGKGQVFISHDVFSIAFGKLKHPFKDIGSKELKNIALPVHVYEVLWDPARAREATRLPPIVPRSLARRRRLPQLLVGAALLVLLALGAAVFLGPARHSPTGKTARHRPTLAIVAFSDETGDERLHQVQIGKIIADALVQKFYEFPHVQLVSPLRVMKVKNELGLQDEQVGRDLSLVEQIAGQTGGRLAISGALKKLGSTFILSADLNDFEQDQLLATSVVQEDSEAKILGALVDSLCAKFQQKIAEMFQIKAGGVDQFISVGELTTTSLEAYAHFVKGYELYASGVFHPGIDEMIRATQIDSNFALAYSLISCAYSFNKEEEPEGGKYFRRALQLKDRFTGVSKEALIFRGNLGWTENDPEVCEKNYRLITELYPDDREGYYYYGLYLAYLKGEHEQAIAQYEKAIELSPGYFPIYRDLAYSLQALKGTDEAVGFLQEYLREFPEEPGAGYARQTIARLRGVG
jgi:adenylate cyclase